MQELQVATFNFTQCLKEEKNKLREMFQVLEETVIIRSTDDNELGHWEETLQKYWRT